jgi:inosine-uridine nucleoside N-ribohydrolase
MTIPLLIDTDPGIDDALAMLLAWGSPEARVEVVTTVAGNVPVDVGTANVRRLIALRRPEPPPLVAVGAAQPLGRSLTTATRYHGEDGLGDLEDWPPLSEETFPDAIEAVVGAARRLGDQLILVALGPLTNVALALAANPAPLRAVGRVVAMGGAVDVPGNVTPTAEFNMHVDPEAAARVLTGGLRLDLVPLDATHQAVLGRQELERALARRPGPLATRVAAFSQRAFRLDVAVGGEAIPSTSRPIGNAMFLHDPLAVAVALDPTLVDWEATRLEVESDGATRRVAGAANCRVAVTVDRKRFVSTFLDRLCPPPRVS